MAASAPRCTGAETGADGARHVLRALLGRRTAGPPEDAILFTEIALTNTCNLSCVHCSRQTLEDRGPELTTEVLSRYLSEFARQGGRMVCFSGGEPLAKKRVLYPAVERTASLGMSPSIISNGQLLSPEVIRELDERGIKAIGISIDGREEYHDRFVARPGAYRKSIEAIRNVIDAGVSCQIMAVPTNESMDDGNFEHILELGRKLGATVYINFPTLTGSFADQESMLLSAENLEKLYRMGREGLVRKDVFKQNHDRLCPAPKRQIYITPYGDVCPCPFIQLSFGNIFRQSLDSIKHGFQRSGYTDRPYACCPPAEDGDFIENVIQPIYQAGPAPLHFERHPLFGDHDPAESI